MKTVTPKIAPLATEEWSNDARAALSGNRAGISKTGVPNVLATLARHPRLVKAWFPFATYAVAESGLPPRDRELVILRVGWLSRSAYEWGQHVAMARRIGVTDEEIVRVRDGAGAPGWSDFDALLLRATDELRAESALGDATWKALSERYDEQQILDLIFTVGQYGLLAMVLNSIGVELDAGTQGLEHP